VDRDHGLEFVAAIGANATRRWPSDRKVGENRT